MRDPSRPVRLSSSPLPLSDGATLTWAGFSEGGSLTTVDSKGVVRSCLRSNGYEWVPLCHTEALKKSAHEHHWVVGVNETQLMCVIVKGDDPYPSTLPRPVLSALPLTMPLACSEPAQPQLEHDRMLQQLMLDEMRSSAMAEGTDESEEVQRNLLRGFTKLDSLNLKLLAAACKAERNARALDLARQLQLPKSLTAAMKLANHYKLPSLAERISMMMPAKRDFYSRIGLKEVAAEPVAVSEAPEAVSNVCCICCEEMTSPAKVDCPAEHEFCVGCIVPWLGERDSGGRRRDTCPLCRSQVTEVRVGDEVWGSGVAERAAGPSTESTSRHQSRVPARRFVPPTLRSGLPRWLLRPGMTFGRCWEYGCGRGEVFGVCEDRGFCDLHCFGCEFHDRMCTQCISSRQYHEGSRRTCYRGFCAHCCFGGCDEHENRW